MTTKTSNEIKRYCTLVSKSFMKGIYEITNLIPDKHYKFQIHNSARVIVFQMINPPESKLKLLSNSDTLSQLARYAYSPEGTQIRFSDGIMTSNDRTVISNVYTFEIPKIPDYYRDVTVDWMESSNIIKHTSPQITLGVDLRDNPISLDFTKNSASHVIIAGETGSGKTNTHLVFGYNISRVVEVDDKMIVLDPGKSGQDWAVFNNAKSLLHPIVTDIDESKRVITWLHQEMNRRRLYIKNESNKGRRVSPSEFNKIYLMVDELQHLTIQGGEKMVEYLSEFASQGRSLGIHLVLATQSPNIDKLTPKGSKSGLVSTLIDNLPVKICGLVKDANKGYQFLGVSQSGIQSLTGSGDFLIRQANILNRMMVGFLHNHNFNNIERVTTQVLELPDLELFDQTDIDDSNTLESSERLPTRIPDDLDFDLIADWVFENKPISFDSDGHITKSKYGRDKFNKIYGYSYGATKMKRHINAARQIQERKHRKGY